MFFLSPKLLQLVNDQGEVPKASLSKLAAVITEAELIAKRMLGCTLEVRGKKFIISNLELYYGGIGDLSSDWYRWKYPHLSTRKVSKISSQIQFSEGLKIYLNQKGGGNYKRMDLVIGPKDVAISLLLRGAYDDDRNLLCGVKGAPNRLIKLMGITDEDHGKSFKVNGSGELNFFDTHSQYITSESQIHTSKRIVGGKATGFADDHYGQRLWNFSFTMLK